jgi:hypothetical protein
MKPSFFDRQSRLFCQVDNLISVTIFNHHAYE